MKIGPAPRKQTNFLSLPAELRLQIYDLATPAGCTYNAHFEYGRGLLNGRVLRYPGLIYTCKQIQNEIVSDWAAKDTFFIDFSTTLDQWDHTLNVLADRLNLIKGTNNLDVHLQVMQYADPSELEWWIYDEPAFLKLNVRFERGELSGTLKISWLPYRGEPDSHAAILGEFQPVYDMIWDAVKDNKGAARKNELQLQALRLGDECWQFIPFAVIQVELQ